MLTGQTMMVNLFWNKTLFRYGCHLLIDTDIGTTVLITMEGTPWLSSLCVECFTAMIEWKGKYLLYILWLWFGDKLNHCSTNIPDGHQDGWGQVYMSLTIPPSPTTMVLYWIELSWAGVCAPCLWPMAQDLQLQSEVSAISPSAWVGLGGHSWSSWPSWWGSWWLESLSLNWILSKVSKNV